MYTAVPLTGHETLTPGTLFCNSEQAWLIELTHFDTCVHPRVCKRSKIVTLIIFSMFDDFPNVWLSKYCINSVDHVIARCNILLDLSCIWCGASIQKDSLDCFL